MSCSTSQCRQHKCDKFIRKEIRVSGNIRMSTYCGVTDRVPGNMSTCPEGVY